jgi:hypothetical protein
MTSDLERGRGSPSRTDPRAAKVAFRLVQDEDGYPPADWEHLWAHQVGESLFVLDNIPFFARGVSAGDLVSVQLKAGMNEFREVVQPSGHSTLRVIFFDTTLISELRSKLKELGCETEQSHLPNLVAVDVPPSTDLETVREVLAEGEDSGKWEYEEAVIH